MTGTPGPEPFDGGTKTGTAGGAVAMADGGAASGAASASAEACAAASSRRARCARSTRSLSDIDRLLRSGSCREDSPFVLIGGCAGAPAVGFRCSDDTAAVRGGV